MQLELPEPYSFELSTERNRRFGPRRFTPHGNLADHYLLTGMRVMD